MVLTRSARQSMLLWLAALFFSGFLHVVLYSVEFADTIMMLFGGVLIIVWAISVRKRVTDMRLQSLMMWIASCLLLHFILQALRYGLFEDEVTVRRFIWYCYSIPATATPILCFLLAVSIYRPSHKPLPGAYLLVGVIGLFLVLGVLSNDLHYSYKAFPDGILDSTGKEVSGWLFWMINLFQYGLYAIAYFIILIKDFRFEGRKCRWIPLFPFLFGVVYFFLYPLDIGHLFFPCRIWNVGEISAFCIVGSIEACIQVGMIPANMGYEKIYSASFVPAVILDSSGTPIYRTQNTEYPFQESEDVKIMSHPISGGSVRWKLDIQQLRRLNQQIEEATHQIEARNAYLAEENRIRKEKAETETRNQLYDRISRIVQPQLDQIDALLDCQELTPEERLQKIAVLSAYIKRRSNMELLTSAGTLSVQELSFAVKESLDSIQLNGVNAVSTCIGAGTYPAAMIICAYENLEKIIEQSLDTLSYLVVSIRSEEHRLTLRIMLRADDFEYEASALQLDHQSVSCKLTITKDREDMLIVLSFTERSRPV